MGHWEYPRTRNAGLSSAVAPIGSVHAGEKPPMLNTRQKVLRNFWYATLPVDKLEGRPEAVPPARRRTSSCSSTTAARRRRSRTAAATAPAKLSKGWIKDGHIVCGYHGWEYDRDGKLVNIPQFPSEQPMPDARAPTFRASERYGYVWVCLGEPLADIPDLPQERDPGVPPHPPVRRHWNCSALRMMENSFDNAHFAFVHKGTFGDINQPKPEKYELTETDYGFVAETIVPVRNPPLAARVTGTTRALDQAQDAQRLVHAVLPHDGHGISLRPAPRHLQLGDADRRRLDPARPDPVPQRPRGGLLDRRTRRLGQGDHRGGPRDPRNRPTPTRSST